jgi:hypothetical protein
MKISDLFHDLHSYFAEKRFLFYALSGMFVLFIAVLFLSNGFSGAAESIENFTFSSNAFRFPQFFFNNIAKPVFVLFSAPFSLFGFRGIQFFNIIVGIAAGFFSYLVAKELKMKQPILAIILCCFTPIFAYNLFSGLPEILFSLFAIATTYLLLKNRYILASLIVSFLPLIRIEGIFLIPVFAIFLVYRKQYWTTFLMFTGILLYSVIGGFINHDFLWLINQNPHKGEIAAYGTGSFFQFVKRSPGYFGIPNEIFYVTGLVAGITLFLRDKKELAKEFLLVFLPFITYFLVHSFMWWSGIGNSQGSNSYMAAIVPFMAVMSTRGLTLFSLMFEIIFKTPWVKTAALYIGIIFVIHLPFVVSNYPIQYDACTKVIIKSSDWLKQNGVEKNKIYYMDPTFPFIMGMDPFDSSRCQKVLDSKSIQNSVEVGSFLIYDERFFPIEKIEFDSLVNNHFFELQKIFDSETSLKIYGRDYRVAVFKRIVPDKSIISENRMMAYGSKEDFRTLVFYDFERTTSSTDSLYFTFDDKSDTKCLKIDSTKNVYLDREFDLSTISFEKPLELYVKLKLSLLDTVSLPLLFNIEVLKDQKQIYLNKIPLEAKEKTLKKWSSLEFRLKLPADISYNGIMKIHILNQNKGKYLIDDYQVGYCFKR